MLAGLAGAGIGCVVVGLLVAVYLGSLAAVGAAVFRVVFRLFS